MQHADWYYEYLRFDRSELALDDIVRQPVTALLGVTEQAREVLQLLNIETIFDLGSSDYFAAARDLTAAARGAAGPVGRFGQVPSQWLDASDGGGSIADMPTLKISTLRGISATGARRLTEATGIETLYDMAHWLPYRAARGFLGEATAGESFVDPEIPTELVPRFNEYSTDKVFYSIFMMDPGPDQKNLTPLTGAIDLAELEKKSQNLRVRTGAIVRFEQAWKPVGLALGDLMHSLALAPGETTRIAMIDWSRRQGVRTSEDITQAESLSNATMHTRAVSEVTRAVANETQSGMSQTNANSTVSNTASSGFGLQNAEVALAAAGGGALAGGVAAAAAGAAGGAGIGLVAGSAAAGIGAVPGAIAGALIGGGAGGLIGVAGGGAAGFLGAADFGSTQNNSANSLTEVVTTTSSTGQRDFAASMAQNITDRTQQHSSATRNRRATIVQEVWQSESEQITTRAVSNYNHMHALTVQYFEVVQMYRVRTGVREVQRALYIPLAEIRWSPENIQRYRSVLLRHALDRRLLESLLLPAETTILQFPMLATADATIRNNFLLQNEPNWGLRFAKDATGQAVAITPLDPWTLPRGVIIEDLRVGRYMRSNSITSMFQEFEAYGQLATPDAIGLPLSDVPRLEWQLPARSDDPATAEPMLLDVVLRLSYRGTDFMSVTPLALGLDVYPADSRALTLPVATFDNTPDADWLSDHLRMFNKHYSRAVWRSVDESDISLLLSDYTYEGRPIVDQIDRKPAAISGQYLVFTYHNHAKDWDKWLAAHGLDEPASKIEMVPMPTGGVFAEAVQGRANSAEKLDLTRFWNWQDSPIPLNAPEIAAIAAGSRVQGSDLRPGQMDAPIVANQTPQALPNPTGLQVAQNVMTADLFRDMSGITATRELAAEAVRQAQAGATAVGQQSASNLAKGMEMQSKAIDKILTMFDGLSKTIATTGFGALAPSGKNIAGQNPSTAGAILNEAKKSDAATKSGGAARPSGPTTQSDSESATPAPSGRGTPQSTTNLPAPEIYADGSTHSLAREGVGTLVSGAGYMPYGLGSALGSVAGQAPADMSELQATPTLLRAKDTGPVDLAATVITHLDSLSDSEDGACVAVSLANFTNAAKLAGADTKLLFGSVEVPLIGGATGAQIPLDSFFYLWFTRSDIAHWLSLPKKCRGAGAPGALLFADLVEGRDYKTSSTGWPAGLVPGAFLQLWDDKDTYLRVRDVGGTSEFGHSLIFRAYGSSANKIIVSDQMGLSREVTYPLFNMSYVIGANLKNAELL
ncbi:hypothetical protein LPB72_18735 [Hydrogenophaga crassostreae]|uniref:Uncharacterized protein n=1 Tax=Hydrogenophaga crassostreae TaxID=1763535 RepID=A0A162VSP7_9BURK|nr:hypothetical protein [Hydrogenophaga crassostreae]AOW13004.1 hypothetical protein LPB072_09240 [Hydrogenophaga crassostreae]OAD40186.1 hypothetical protein LPB72_18735 [Hydrogenophaga crassostreae]